MVIVFYLLLVVWSVRLCVGFRLPHNKLSSSKNELRQMAYNVSGLCAGGALKHERFNSPLNLI